MSSPAPGNRPSHHVPRTVLAVVPKGFENREEHRPRCSKAKTQESLRITTVEGYSIVLCS